MSAGGGREGGREGRKEEGREEVRARIVNTLNSLLIYLPSDLPNCLVT